MDEQPQQPIADNQTILTPQQAPADVSAAPQALKKGPGLVWLFVILLVGVIGVGAYMFYSLQPKTVEKSPAAIPGIMTEESKPATPTITSSDTVSDIEKDLSGTTVEAGSTTEFDADLQSL